MKKKISYTTIFFFLEEIEENYRLMRFVFRHKPFFRCYSLLHHKRIISKATLQLNKLLQTFGKISPAFGQIFCRLGKLRYSFGQIFNRFGQFCTCLNLRGNTDCDYTTDTYIGTCSTSTIVQDFTIKQNLLLYRFNNNRFKQLFVSQSSR